MHLRIEQISYREAIDFLLPKHYAGRKPTISMAFGWVAGDILVAVCTFGKPASPPLCKGIAGIKNASAVYELNRLCRIEGLHKPLSQFVSGCLKKLKPKNWIIVAYADIGMHHTGYVYQACNFLYTGKTKARTDKYTPGNKHCRHYDNENQKGFRKIRTAKHRYVWLCTGHKKLKKQWHRELNYPVQAYPKEENQKYVLGKYQQPRIIDVRT